LMVVVLMAVVAVVVWCAIGDVCYHHNIKHLPPPDLTSLFGFECLEQRGGVRLPRRLRLLPDDAGGGRVSPPVAGKDGRRYVVLERQRISCCIVQGEPRGTPSIESEQQS
jgi:hypothetical protein